MRAPCKNTKLVLTLGFARRVGSFEDISVERDITPQILRHIFFREDGRHGAFRLTGTTIYALIGVDKELIRTLVDAVHRTDINTSTVLHTDAGFSNYVGHFSRLVRPVHGDNTKDRLGRADFNAELGTGLAAGGGGHGADVAYRQGGTFPFHSSSGLSRNSVALRPIT